MQETAAKLRREVWTQLREAGLGSIPSNTFSFYDQVLDTSVMIDAIPGRYRHLDGLDRYSAFNFGRFPVD